MNRFIFVLVVFVSSVIFCRTDNQACSDLSCCYKRAGNEENLKFYKCMKNVNCDSAECCKNKSYYNSLSYKDAIIDRKNANQNVAKEKYSECINDLWEKFNNKECQTSDCCNIEADHIYLKTQSESKGQKAWNTCMNKLNANLDCKDPVCCDEKASGYSNLMVENLLKSERDTKYSQYYDEAYSSCVKPLVPGIENKKCYTLECCDHQQFLLQQYYQSLNMKPGQIQRQLAPLHNSCYDSVANGIEKIECTVPECCFMKFSSTLHSKGRSEADQVYDSCLQKLISKPCNNFDCCSMRQAADWNVNKQDHSTNVWYDCIKAIPAIKENCKDTNCCKVKRQFKQQSLYKNGKTLKESVKTSAEVFTTCMENLWKSQAQSISTCSTEDCCLLKQWKSKDKSKAKFNECMLEVKTEENCFTISCCYKKLFNKGGAWEHNGHSNEFMACAFKLNPYFLNMPVIPIVYSDLVY